VRLPPQSRRLRLLLACVLLITAGGIAIRIATEPGPSCQQSLIPAYFYPGANWVKATDSKPPPKFMIIDITSSGAGTAPDPNYQAAVKRARAAGITLVGYSATDYGRRLATAVELDVRHYKSWYGVTDIFLDGASSGDGSLGYYRQLSGYIHAMNPGSMVILNPGTYPSEHYMSIGDIVLVFEGTYAEYLSTSVPGWVDDYPASKFAYVIYGTPESRLADVISTSQRKHVGYIYVTPNTGVNPYRSLAGYWARENAIIAACA
jgi:Spherulation-specific family 4